MGQKNGLYAFGYNSAESEPIWMKSGTMWANLVDVNRDEFVTVRINHSRQGHRYKLYVLYGKTTTR